MDHVSLHVSVFYGQILTNSTAMAEKGSSVAVNTYLKIVTF